MNAYHHKHSLSKHALFTRVMHWLTGTLILAMLGSGLLMVRMDDANPWKYDVLYVWHQQIGILTLALVNVRLLMRLRIRLTPLPASMSALTRKTAHSVYVLMYGFMLLMPLTGLFMSAAYLQGRGIPFFGMVIASFTGPSEAIYSIGKLLHSTMAYSLGGLVLTHLLATLRHRFFDVPEHDVLARML
jgi:cytochrome b561